MQARTSNRTFGSHADQPVTHLSAGTTQPSNGTSNPTGPTWTADPTKLRPGKNPKYYGVLRGHKPGIYYSWTEAEAQVHKFKNCAYKSFTDPRAVEAYVNQDLPVPPLPHPASTSENTPAVLQLRASERNETVSRPAIPVPASSYEQEDQSTTSSQTSIANLHPCNCGKREKDLEATVQCANIESCRIGEYHRTCVGLANRPVPAGWLCVFCRPSHIRLSTPHQSSPMTLPHAILSQEASQNPQGIQPTPNLDLSKAEDLPPPLHPEQERVVDAIMAGHNVFYTGSAGTGKSTVLREFVRRLRRQGMFVDIIAPSGIAALNVGGKTIHSYAGWYPDMFKEPIHKLVKKGHGKQVRVRLCKTDVLVLDEISMVERDVFSRLDALMREARHEYVNHERHVRSYHDRDLPFGGCQIIVTGDFAQLPPVRPFKYCLWCGGAELEGWEESDNRTLTCGGCKRTFYDSDKWPFTSGLWEECQFQYFELHYIHRQNDEQFIQILRKFRLRQQLTPEEKGLLTRPKPDPIGAVQLMPTKRQVELENNKNYARLITPQKTFSCLDVFSWRNESEPNLQVYYERLYPGRHEGPLRALKEHRFDEIVKLKAGMLVILQANLSFAQGLVNGSQGKIVGFTPYDAGKPVVSESADSPEASPDKGRTNDYNPKIAFNEYKEALIHQFVEKLPAREWPIVEFRNGVTTPIYAHCEVNEVGSQKPYSLLARVQIPLIPAWAITIHKSQGMTLDRVIVNLAKSFEGEMAYVALSRARNLAGLKVNSLPEREDDRNPEVAEFLRRNFGGQNVMGCIAAPPVQPAEGMRMANALARNGAVAAWQMRMANEMPEDEMEVEE